MTTATTTKIAKATWRDGSGNTLTLVVRDGRVRLANQHQLRLSLSSVMFATSHNGSAAQGKALRDAVKDCTSSDELVKAARTATRLSGWVAA